MTVRAFWTTASTSARQVLAERGGFFVTIGFYLLVVAVLSGVWRVAAHAGGGEVAGYSAVALTWYIATSEAATVGMDLRMVEDVGNDIGSGAVAVELLRPASVLAVRVASVLGRSLPRTAAIALVGAALAAFVGGAPPRPAALLLAIPSLVLAVACSVVAQHAFAGAAFWLRNAGSTWFLYQKLVFVLGGMLIPLEVLPGWLQAITSVLPFRAMAYAPARIASGHLEPALLVQQAAWLVALSWLAAVVFGAGERRLQVVGG
jgi:ABC-2 type transport system permease protein